MRPSKSIDTQGHRLKIVRVVSLSGLVIGPKPEPKETFDGSKQAGGETNSTPRSIPRPIPP